MNNDKTNEKQKKIEKNKISEKKNFSESLKKNSSECFDYNSMCLSYENENNLLNEKYQHEKSILFL